MTNNQTNVPNTAIKGNNKAMATANLKDQKQPNRNK